MPRDLIVLACVIVCTALSVGGITLPSIEKHDFGSIGAESKETRVLFVGDILLARYVETLIAEQGSDYPFIGLAPLLTRYETIIGNFEAPISINHTPTPADSLSFSVATSSIAALSSYVDIVSLANNHTLDQGVESFVHTIDALERAGVRTFGHPTAISSTTVTMLTHADQQIALVGLNATHQIDTDGLRALFADLRSRSSMQIAYVHWGIEYETQHDESQSTLARYLIDSGADAVIGHHPHVIQDIAVYKGAPIFYSVGNFVFDQYFSDEVQTGLGVEIAFVDQRVTYRLIPFTSLESESSPRLLPYDERLALIESIIDRSAPEMEFHISADGILELSKSLASL